jgi:uncharacterized protein YjbI with pentapeptide repeats
VKVVGPNLKDEELQSLSQGPRLKSGEEYKSSAISAITVEEVARGVFFLECKIEGIELVSAQLPELTMKDCSVADSEFSGATIAPCYIERVTFDKLRASGVQVYESKLKDVTFIECKLDLANFRSTKLKRVRFESCNLIDVDFAGATLEDVEMFDCEMKDTNFSNIHARNLDLRGSRLSGVVGATSLKGAIVTTDQLFTFNHALARDLGIVVQDDTDDTE